MVAIPLFVMFQSRVNRRIYFNTTAEVSGWGARGLLDKGYGYGPVGECEELPRATVGMESIRINACTVAWGHRVTKLTMTVVQIAHESMDQTTKSVWYWCKNIRDRVTISIRRLGNRVDKSSDVSFSQSGKIHEGGETKMSEGLREYTVWELAKDLFQDVGLSGRCPTEV